MIIRISDDFLLDILSKPATTSNCPGGLPEVRCFVDPCAVSFFWRDRFLILIWWFWIFRFRNVRKNQKLYVYQTIVVDVMLFG